MNDAGVFGVITTHYQNLKKFANETPGIVNGAMLYDRHLMKPLFQLSVGNPGSSFAIEIAKKIGIPADVLDYAADIVGSDYINMDKYLLDIARDRRYWENKRQDIRVERKKLDKIIERYEADLQKLIVERREILKEAKSEAKEILSKSNASIENAIHEIKKAQAEREQTKLVRRQIDELKSRLAVSSPYVTIAGQTAPGKGICIKGAPFGVGPDGICRFIRVRLGGGRTFDGIGMAGADHSITDHCSISWTIDESFSSRGAKNITLQNTLISEALNIAGHKNYKKGKGHGYAATIGGNVGSFHHNLLAHCAGRNWSMGGGLDGNGYYSGALDIFNNVVYNWGGRATDGGAHEVNFVNNYYKMGPSTTQKYILRAQLEGVGKGSQSYYCEGNIRQDLDGTKVTDNEELRRYELSNGQVLDWNVWVDKPFFPSYAEVESAEDAYKSTLSDVGCNMPMFDEHDQRIVRETLDGTYTYTGSVGKTPGIIDNEKDAGGYEDYPEEKRAADFDTDGDGLPDWWEELHQTDPNSPAGDFSDSNADPDKDGYTNLEEYLDWMSVPHYVSDGKDVTIDVAPLFVGYTNPTFRVEGDKTVVVDGSRLTVEVAGRQKGITYLQVVATDEAGSTMTRRVGLCVR